MTAIFYHHIIIYTLLKLCISKAFAYVSWSICEFVILTVSACRFSSVRAKVEKTGTFPFPATCCFFSGSISSNTDPRYIFSTIVPADKSRIPRSAIFLNKRFIRPASLNPARFILCVTVTPRTCWRWVKIYFASVTFWDMPI